MYMYIHEVHVMVHISLLIAKISTLLKSNHFHTVFEYCKSTVRDYFISWFTRDKHVCNNLFLRARLINICFIINNNHTTITSSLHSWWRGSHKLCENFLHANKRSDLLNTVTVNHFFIRCDFILWSTGDKLFTKTRFCDQ